MCSVLELKACWAAENDMLDGFSPYFTKCLCWCCLSNRVGNRKSSGISYYHITIRGQKEHHLAVTPVVDDGLAVHCIKTLLCPQSQTTSRKVVLSIATRTPRCSRNDMTTGDICYDGTHFEARALHPLDGDKGG
jgi:hypothetical protein